MTTATESAPVPAPAPGMGRRSSHLSFIMIVGLLLIIGAMLCWHFNVLSRKPRIAIVAGEGPYFDLIVEGARQAEKQYDVNLTVVRAKGDVQADTIRNLMSEDFDGVAISPINPLSEAGLLADV